ncbi:hypothetical protein E8D34_11545 [Nocardioides sp. GY 10113]|uniref:hypothetical protein n=1 Tax=Nocardioides sp. GY 10113 TaxID=2569761 RepID=UPI0010A8C641|nr:hypothetical protein [Nocardioides sp. GY 10113]TIC86303.1 hypothetical protein E8D34_11545 [Nocardioides sp. GY 10113]
MRGIFFDEDEARLAALSLVRGGFAAEVTRERLSGEDDDEGHPWAVTTDAPEIVLEMLVETYDGWLDLDGPTEAPEPSRPDPLPLPDEPKRIKRRPV